MDGADLVEAAQCGIRNLDGVSQKADVCKSMLEKCMGFSDNIRSTVDSFMGTWNLETMGNKIKEICRCVTLGGMIKQFGLQIKNLVLMMLEVLQTAREKFKNLPIPDIG